MRQRTEAEIVEAKRVNAIYADFMEVVKSYASNNDVGDVVAIHAALTMLCGVLMCASSFWTGRTTNETLEFFVQELRRFVHQSEAKNASASVN